MTVADFLKDVFGRPKQPQAVPYYAPPRPIPVVQAPIGVAVPHADTPASLITSGGPRRTDERSALVSGR